MAAGTAFSLANVLPSGVAKPNISLIPLFTALPTTSPPNGLIFYETLKVKRMDETKIDRAAMGRLAKALSFICGQKNATVLALQAAADSGTDRDIKAARTLFLRLKPGERQAAMAMLND